MNKAIESGDEIRFQRMIKACQIDNVPHCGAIKSITLQAAKLYDTTSVEGKIGEVVSYQLADLRSVGVRKYRP